MSRFLLAGSIWLLVVMGLICRDVAAAPATKTAEEKRIEEIIVSATRRDTLLQDTPIAISVLTGDTLQSLGARDVIDWFDLVPGLTYNDDAFGGRRLTIRGVSVGAEVRPSVGEYLDDTPLANFAGGAALPAYSGMRPQMVDMARVEVLKGPQGTLFGGGALSGAVRNITNAPDLERTYTDAEVGYSYSSHGGTGDFLNGMVNLPVRQDVLALRLVGYRRNDAGYIDNREPDDENTNEVETWGARASLRWQPLGALSVILKGQVQDRDTGGISSNDTGVGDWDQVRFVRERDDEYWKLFTLNVSYEFGWGRIESITSLVDRWPRWTFDVTEFGQFFYSSPPYGLDLAVRIANHFEVEIEDKVQEVRMTSVDGGRLSWVVGAYLERQQHWVTQDWLSPGFDAATGGLAAAAGFPDTPAHGGSESKLDQRAVYGELAYDLTDRWEGSVGTRISKYQLDHWQFIDGYDALGYADWMLGSTETFTTPQATLAYRPTSGHLYYLTVARGARPGGPNQFSDEILAFCGSDLAAAGHPNGVPPMESDSLVSYEIGAKSTWFDSTLVIDAAAYHIDWNDIQLFSVLQCGYGFGANAARANIDGGEVEVLWEPVTRLQVALGGAYIDSRLSDDEAALAAEDGDAMPGVPEWTFYTNISHELAVKSSVTPYWNASYRYVPSTWTAFDEAQRTRVPSRRVLNLRAGVRLREWTLELFADNALDERLVLAHSSNIVGEWDVLAPPRTIGMSLRFEQ
jgi:outer membrane receptor protein involved in Fe transport